MIAHSVKLAFWVITLRIKRKSIPSHEEWKKVYRFFQIKNFFFLLLHLSSVRQHMLCKEWFDDFWSTLISRIWPQAVKNPIFMIFFFQCANDLKIDFASFVAGKSCLQPWLSSAREEEKTKHNLKFRKLFAKKKVF